MQSVNTCLSRAVKNGITFAPSRGPKPPAQGAAWEVTTSARLTWAWRLQAVRERPVLSIIGSWNDPCASHAPRQDLEPPGWSPATAAYPEYKHKEPGIHLDPAHTDPRLFIKYATHQKASKTTSSQTSSYTKYTPSTPVHSSSDPCYSYTEDIWSWRALRSSIQDFKPNFGPPN